jgi:predicted RNA-binding Zn ribbon-like protein
MTKSRASWEQAFDLSGGVLCLDFANTVSKRNAPDEARDELVNYPRFLGFAKQSRMLSPQQAELLRSRSALRTDEDGTNVMRAAAILREAIYRVFSALAGGRPAPPKDIKLIDDFAIEALRHRRLMPKRTGGYRWQWKTEESERLEQLLWPVALSAADLLTSEKLSGVRECAAGDCAWLFLDESRNHSRRWCDMKVCGNRQKARRHYHRARQSA